MHKSWQCLDYNGKVWSCLNDLKKDGLVKKIGVSIYSPKELENITKYINLDIVQTPFNLIDRIQDTGWLLSLNKMGVEIHVRSIFLQGLLLMKEQNIPKNLILGEIFGISGLNGKKKIHLFLPHIVV